MLFVCKVFYLIPEYMRTVNGITRKIAKKRDEHCAETAEKSGTV